MAQEKPGLKWQNDLYLSLLHFVNENKNNLIIDENIYKTITPDQLKSLSKRVFPKYGHRKSHQEKITFFLQHHFQDIIADLPDLGTGKIINAPSLKEWLIYKEKLCSVISMYSEQKEIKKFLKNPDCNLSSDMKTKIIRGMYGIEDKDIEAWMKKKLNNALWFKRSEIISEIKNLYKNKKIFNSSLTSENKDMDLEEPFHGFLQSEINIPKIQKKKLDAFINSLNIVSEVARKIPLESTNKINKNDSDAKNHKSVKLLKEKMCCSLIEFFKKEDADDQTQFLQKIIMIRVSSDKFNAAMEKSLIRTNKLSQDQKTMILNYMYNEVQEKHYSLLDLMIDKKSLIKKKVEEVKSFFKLCDINFKTEIQDNASLDEIELKFYEVLENLWSNRDNS